MVNIQFIGWSLLNLEIFLFLSKKIFYSFLISPLVSQIILLLTLTDYIYSESYFIISGKWSMVMIYFINANIVNYDIGM